MPATTPTHGFPYPEDSDLVMDGAAAVEDLARAVDTTLDGFRAQTRLRRIGRGRVVIDNPPNPGQSRTRTVSLDPAFGLEGSTPRVVVSTGGDARANGQPYTATVVDVIAQEFVVEVFPVADPGSSGLGTGTTLWVDWIAVGEAVSS